MLKPLSETIRPEKGGYKPAYGIKYPNKPGGFDLSDMVQFKQGQPYDYFHKLRKAAPVSWWELPEGVEMAGYWSLTRYEDVKACDSDAKRFSSQKGGILMGYMEDENFVSNLRPVKRLSAASLNSMINLDQPFHIPLRMEHRPFFTPDFVKKLRGSVEAEVDRLLDKMEAIAKTQNGYVDMVPHFSERLPLFTLCEMLGVDQKDRPKIVRWMHYLELAGYILADPESSVSPLFVGKFLWNVRQMFRFGEKILQERRENPRDDLLTLIANAKLDGKPMEQNYLDGSWLLIVFAGNDTTRNSLSGTMKLLTQFPDQKRMLTEDPALMPKMTPEALRLVSPVMYMRRTALEDAQFSEQKIAKGEKIVMWYGAANRDPEIFADPDRMDIHRNNAADHLAFGTGPHVCLGQRIAIMQLEAAYARILARFPKIRWTGRVNHAPSNFVHAISSLTVKLH